MRGMGPSVCTDLACVRGRSVLHGWVAMWLALQATTELGRGWRGAWARLLEAWAYRWQDRGQLATLGPAQSTEFQIEPTLEQIIIVIENTPFWRHSAHLKGGPLGPSKLCPPKAQAAATRIPEALPHPEDTALSSERRRFRHVLAI